MVAGSSTCWDIQANIKEEKNIWTGLFRGKKIKNNAGTSSTAIVELSDLGITIEPDNTPRILESEKAEYLIGLYEKGIMPTFIIEGADGRTLALSTMVVYFVEQSDDYYLWRVADHDLAVWRHETTYAISFKPKSE